MLTTHLQNNGQMMSSRFNRKLFYFTLFLSFLISLLLYILTLAPTATFEDSGELIAAAYHLGVPHQPGYPLFTLLGRIFSMLPISNVAYRLNLMSAVLSAFGAMFLTWAVILLIEDAFTKTKTPKKKETPQAQAGRNPKSEIVKYASALASGIFMATAFENWEQSIITEVYGLNTMLVGLIVLLAVMWRKESSTSQRTVLFLLTCYILGLMLSNHTTSLMFIPILFGFAVIEDRKFTLNIKRLAAGSSFLLLGLTPYIYLPIASTRNPLMDWGNPENWTNFIRTISRHQYGLGEEQTLAKFIPQLQTYFELLAEQWLPLILICPILGLFVLWKNQRNWFYFSILFFLFAAPITTYVTDFDVTVRDPFVAAEHRALVSVFYIPSYICIAFLIGIGIYFLALLVMSKTKSYPKIEYVLALVIILLPFGFSYGNYDKVNMRDYYFTEDYVQNLFSVATENCVVFANWDPFYFPLNYYQFVEGERPDIIAIDQQLLRRSWYIQWLKDHYPEFVKLAEREIEAFLKAVEPFENKETFDGNFIQKNYINMINAMIDRSIQSGRDVYLTYNAPPGIAQNYRKESVISAIQLKLNPELTPVDFESLFFRHLFDGKKDRMAKIFQNYYGGLIFSRARLEEARGNRDAAIKFYRETAKFMPKNPRYLQQVNSALQRLTEVAK